MPGISAGTELSAGSLIRTSHGGGATPPTSFLLLEDGVSFLLLEDGTSFLGLETGNG
jgi:hypothetical protein